MESLHHNGVLVPLKYVGKGLTIKVRNETIRLTEEQEEMAMAWAKKVGTPYVEDPVFAENFHQDFSLKLGIEVKPGEADYSEVLGIVEKERAQKASLTRDERKRLAADRKAIREANKENYGLAVVDGERIDIGNYTVEPSSIFMGRGKHPMRGKWKEGPQHDDIVLNLSPDAPKPPGNWNAIVWQPENMWIARWRDRLSGKVKYVWPHDSSLLKQSKDIEKFDMALELHKHLKKVQIHIEENLDSDGLRRRKTATVAFLINHCNFRVGDEKDEEEEAETIGASTLKPEHISYNGDGTVNFDFLGKDSIRHNICTLMPNQVIKNLKEFSTDAGSALFEGVDSKRVSEFLDEVMPGLSSKVFRTHYASTAVENKLRRTRVDPEKPDYVKKHAATIANLEAAVVCNHKRTISKTWKQSLERQKEMLKTRRQRARENTRKYKQRIRNTEATYRERITRYEKKMREDKEKLNEYNLELKEREKQGRSTKGIKKRISSKKKVIKNQKARIKETKRKLRERLKRLQDQMEKRRQKDRELIEKTKLKIEAKELTRDYNLNTSLKSYIDPRVYFEWGRKVNYDWKKYYAKTLQSKFSWVEVESSPLSSTEA